MKLVSRQILLLVLLLLLPLAVGSCGAGGSGSAEQSVKGQVVGVDAGAKTFSLQGNDGKRYDFKLKAGGSVDLVHVKEHMDNKKVIEVRYTGSTAPYEASYAH
ncbi:MAG TPA: hypothetical protein VIL85_03880 [Thermomicrobiales bacterium]|jgi:hypothetical protein